MQGKANITERAARWSATHRKTAIWGWLGIVFTLMVLIMGGGSSSRRTSRRSTRSHASHSRPSAPSRTPAFVRTRRW